ncbi:DUF3320 domain-containing protein [Thalassiella azotivora]
MTTAPTGTTTGSASIDLQATPLLSYAMAHNRVPVVEDLSIRYAGPDVDAATLRLEVRDAEGVLSSPCERTVDLGDGRVTEVPDVRLTLDPAAMLQVTEQRPGRVTASLLVDGQVVAQQSTDVQVLAAKQWLAFPPELGLEMLAAFVMPNDPAVARLVDEAADLLRERTGSSAVQGYQAGAERVDEIVRAAFDAMRARSVRYSEPPASWADHGQKVRTPQEVLDGRVGTCLDTVVTLAAVLEQCGVRPLLWVVEGHAFLGYWRDEQSLSSIVHTEVAPVVNLVDLGLIRLVETTIATERADAADSTAPDLDAAHRAPYAKHLTGDLDTVLGVVDVYTARRNGVLPLPSRTRTDDGQVQVVTYVPQEHSSPPRPERTRDDAAQPSRRADVPPRVQQWKNALLDLSLRNRLINFTERAAVALTVPAERLGAVEDVVHEGKPLHLLPSDLVDQVHVARGVRSGKDLPPDLLAQLLDGRQQMFTDVTTAAYSTRMRNLAYRARTVVEETGANNLYLALGSLVWEWDGKPLRSPLVLVPVRLVTRARQSTYRLELDETGASTPNFCLLEKLKQAGVEVPGLAEPEGDGAGIDLDAALRAVRVAVAEAGRPWRVEATAHVSILQFAKFRLWKDLDEHWETLTGNALVRHLVHTPTDPFDDPAPAPDGVDLDDLAERCPVPADASQLEAVADAVAGRTFVLEGPPGTGKSQTITNLLARAVAEGRRVLFVAEKRAALDVVQKRLDQVGMGPFSLDLHDKGSKPAVVRAQVRQALEHAVTVDETGLQAHQQDLRSARRALARYATRLHEPNGAGLSLYGARDVLLSLGDDGPTLDVPRSLLVGDRAAEVGDVKHLLENLPDVADPARPSPDHPWGFAGAVGEGLDADAVRRAVAALDDATRHAPTSGPLGDALAAARTPAHLAVVASLASTPVPLAALDETRSQRWGSAADGLLQRLAAFGAAQHPGMDVATPAVLDLPLAEIHAQAQTAAASSWFGRKKRLLAVLERLRPGLRPGSEVAHKQVAGLTAGLAQVGAAAQTLAQEASSLPGVTLPRGWNPLTTEGREVLDRQVRWLRWAGQAVAPRPDDVFVERVRAWLSSGSGADVVAVEATQRLAAAAQQVQAVTAGTDGDAARWSGDVGFLGRWSATRDARDVGDPQLLALRRWGALVAALEPLRPLGLTDARDQLLTGAVGADDALTAFTRGMAAASVEERRAETGLDAFDAVTHERSIHRFTTAAGQVRELLHDELPRQVVQARPFRPETARGRVGALQRELAKQRRGLGVRALLAEYGDLITQVMPCVLVSPDSLARFFPAQAGLFDLVVFDEASQIRVADAVGAMGRSGSVVVVGDSKQMPPTSFAEPTLGADDEDVVDDGVLAVEDEESILSEAVQARVPRRWLSWHYRSQEESLIAFSNRHYYEDKLSSFPAPVSATADAGTDGYGISLVRVDGTFHRTGKGKLLRTNPVEAEAVVAEIRRRFDAAGDGAGSISTAPSIGVVTFNQQQRAYVEALLRDAGDDRLVEALEAPDGLFVKNLENVQGDERDVILFSTAFSVNDRGVLPLNFGPLNREGGERRLNVAVTRARRQVLVFSSFDPAQIRAEETTSVGIKHLRAYLELAQAGSGTAVSAHRPTRRDRHRDQVADVLRTYGLVVSTDVGLSDFRVDLSLALPEDPDRPLVAVLLDGPVWASRRTVGDRDGLPVEVLSRMLRWPAVERVWTPAWTADPTAVAERLVEVTRRAADGPVTSAPAEMVPPAVDVPQSDAGPAAAEAAPDGVLFDLGDDGTLRGAPPAAPVEPAPAASAPAAEEPWRLPGEADFVPWTPDRVRSRSTLDALPSPRAVAQVRSVVEQVVAAEGPVHQDRLAKLVASAFDLTRVSASRADAILRTVPPELRTDTAEPFLWPANVRPTDWTGFRRPVDGGSRPIEEISLRELGNAMAALCVASMGIETEELLKESAAVFGLRRVTATVRDRLQQALDTAVASGRVQVSGTLVTATPGGD